MSILSLPGEQKPLLPGQQPGQFKWGMKPDGSGVALVLFGLAPEPVVIEMDSDKARKMCCEGIQLAGNADEVKAARKVIV